MESKRTYPYTKLSQLSHGMDKVNVAGVVVNFRPPDRTRGQDCSCSVRIIDDSTDRPIMCTLFNRELLKLPMACNDGDVIFLRRLKVSDQSSLVGSNFSSWILFQNGGNVPLKPSANSTVSDVERGRMQELRAWKEQTSTQIGRPAPSPHDDPTTSDSVQTLVNNTSHPVAAASSSSLNYQPYRRHHKLSITDLGALTTGQGSVAVCGVVQYFKPPTQSRGSDYFITLGLLDETCTEEAINCILFNPSEQRLLTNIPVGEIVLLKGMKTSTFNDRPQATGYKEAIVVSNSGSNCLYLLSDTEKAIMKRLKEWSKQQGILQLNTKLSHINVDNFFNIICRVAAVYTSAADNRMMLKVFDGTAPKFSSESLDLTQGEWISDLDRQLVLEYAPLICDVLVFDWNGQFSIESGQYLSLSNVHVEFCKRGPFVNPSSIPTVKFTLSSKRSDGAITILYRGESKTIDDHLSNFFRPYGPFPVYKKTLSDHSSRPLFNIVAEEGKQVCSIHEAIKSPPETMLVIEGQIISFSRGPIEEMCQLRCSMCKTRYVTPQATDLPLPTQMVCVFCSDSKGSGPRVQYMYVFVMRLKDRTGTLDVCVTAEDGEMFLNQIQPVNLYTQKASRERLLKLLYLLTGGNDPFYPYPSVLDFERPCVKCCVTKFTSIEGKEQFTLIATVCSVSV